MTLRRVLIMAGGTGGHIFPGLALARYLRTQGVDVYWLGTQLGLEAQLVPQDKLPLHCITVSGLRGKGVSALLKAPGLLLISFIQACSILRKIQPDVVIGLGGFVTGPGGLASWFMRYPLVIHEQNAKPGLTNKILAKFSNKILEGFPEAFKARKKVIVMGNPVRQEIECLPPPKERLSQRPHTFRLLVLGGSLGAQAINEILPQALALMSPAERPEVWHQTGKKHFDASQTLYLSNHLQVKLVPFIEDMAAAYEWADIVLCRAGALTVAELCAAGLGAIFIPYPHAVDDHQTANAHYMVQQNAAVCIQQSVLNAQDLANVLKEFARSPEKRLAMANAAYRLRFIEVSKKIFDILCAETG